MKMSWIYKSVPIDTRCLWMKRRHICICQNWDEHEKLKPKPYLRWPRGPEVDPSIETPTEELGLGQVISEFSALLTILYASPWCPGWVINRLHIVKTADDQIMGSLKANRRVRIDHTNRVTLGSHQASSWPLLGPRRDVWLRQMASSPPSAPRDHINGQQQWKEVMLTHPTVLPRS